MLLKPLRLRAAFPAAVIILALAAPALAQSSLGIGTAEPSALPVAGNWAFLNWINEQQQTFYRSLTGALKAMREDPWQLWTLVSLSFLYGIFHAAGPGHGKAVISSYMLANEVALRRGVMLSFMSAFLQGVMALVVVGLAWLVLRNLSISMTDTTWFMETASYALIALFGAWLLWRKLRPLIFSGGQQGHTVHHHDHAHAHHDHHHHHGHHHDHDHHGHGHGHDHGHHGHAHGEACPDCGHVHMPDPKALSAGNLSLREAWAAVIAVGLRPCSGALLVLTFALLNSLWLGGALSVFAMALGTAITVSILATLAVTAKGAAMRFGGAGHAGTIGTIIEITGALLVLVLGLLLFAAALSA